MTLSSPNESNIIDKTARYQTDLPPSNQLNPKEEIKKKIDSLVGGLNDAIGDITAIEVNTMIVSNITGLKFNAYLAYKLVFRIPHNQDNKYVASKDRNEEYYKKLYEQYQNNAWYPNLSSTILPSGEEIPTNTNGITIEMLNTTRKAHIKLRERLWDEAKVAMNNQNYDLPDYDLSTIEPTQRKVSERALKKLLENKEFLGSLRKLNELRSLIEKGEAANTDNVYDTIYAQTIIQIDGDVSNLFNRSLFKEDPETRKFLIDIHQNAVNTGQQTWQSLLHLVVDLLSKIPKMFPDFKE